MYTGRRSPPPARAWPTAGRPRLQPGGGPDTTCAAGLIRVKLSDPGHVAYSPEESWIPKANLRGDIHVHRGAITTARPGMAYAPARSRAGSGIRRAHPDRSESRPSDPGSVAYSRRTAAHQAALRDTTMYTGSPMALCQAPGHDQPVAPRTGSCSALLPSSWPNGPESRQPGHK